MATNLKNIWVLDDDQSIRWVIEKALNRNGYIVKTFDSVEDAMDLIGTSNPDLILSDVRMPGKSGLDFLEIVKRDNPQIPVIIMTAYSDVETTVDSYKAGAYEYISKPFDINDLLKIVNKASSSTKVLKTDEEKKIVSKFRKEMKIYNEKVSQWRKSVSMIKFKELRKLYNEAGIKIYAFKPRVFEKDNTDDDIRYGMRAAKALGASHVTLEHPSDDEHTARLGKIAEEEDILVGYHGHLQQTPVFWDKAISQSNSNQINLDLGHYVAAENPDPLGFIVDKHDKIISMHLKDRQKLSNGGLNLIWGKGDTPITEVVQLIKKNGYDFYVTIELEHDIPDGSDDLKEVKRCLAYIKKALE